MAQCKERQKHEGLGVLGKKRQAPSNQIFGKLTAKEAESQRLGSTVGVSGTAMAPLDGSSSPLKGITERRPGKL